MRGFTTPGARCGAASPLYTGAGRPGTGAPQARVEPGIEMAFDFKHAALGALADPTAPLTIEFRYADDFGFSWRCDVIVRREGADAQGRLLCTVRGAEPKIRSHACRRAIMRIPERASGCE